MMASSGVVQWVTAQGTPSDGPGPTERTPPQVLLHTKEDVHERRNPFAQCHELNKVQTTVLVSAHNREALPGQSTGGECPRLRPHGTIRYARQLRHSMTKHGHEKTTGHTMRTCQTSRTGRLLAVPVTPLWRLSPDRRRSRRVVGAIVGARGCSAAPAAPAAPAQRHGTERYARRHHTVLWRHYLHTLQPSRTDAVALCDVPCSLGLWHRRPVQRTPLQGKDRTRPLPSATGYCSLSVHCTDP
jgi:hypothetical protein